MVLRLSSSEVLAPKSSVSVRVFAAARRKHNILSYSSASMCSRELPVLTSSEAEMKMPPIPIDAESFKEEKNVPMLTLAGLAFAIVATSLPLPCLLRVGSTCKAFHEELQRPELWEHLLAVRFPQPDNRNGSVTSPESTTTGGCPRQRFMSAIVNDARISSASPDFTIAGLSKANDPTKARVTFVLPF